MMTECLILVGSSEEHIMYYDIFLSESQWATVLFGCQHSLNYFFVLSKAIRPKIDKIISIHFLTFVTLSGMWTVCDSS